MPGDLFHDIFGGVFRFLLELLGEGVLRHLVRIPGFILIFILHILHLFRPDPDYDARSTLFAGIAFWLVALSAGIWYFL